MSENVSELAQLLKGLSPEQLDWVQARLVCQTNAEACRKAQVVEGTYYRWKREGVPLDEIVNLAKSDSVLLAAERLRRLTSKAVTVLDEEMDNRRSRLDAAKEVLDRAGLPKTSKQEVSGADGAPLFTDGSIRVIVHGGGDE